jgi:crotonobetainyl-CoA:carnitine CoA-transferase CaiB-like acyl-CoA transferase
MRIVEIGVWHAGPGGTAILADLGAEVIKVEGLSGDPERYQGSFGPMATQAIDTADWSLMFEMSNRGKKGICVDLRQEAGREVVFDLLRTADALVTNLRLETIRSFGLDHASVAEINPKLVTVHASGFGAAGPAAGHGAFDTLGQAVSGMMYLAGQSEPRPLSVIVLDQMTAICVSHAVLTGLLARERHGTADDVQVSLFGSAVWLMHANLLTSSVLGETFDISWDRTRQSPLRTTFECSDGAWIADTNHPEVQYWGRFCDAIGLPELADDPRYRTPASRKANAAELYAVIDAAFRTRTRADWLETGRKHGLLFAPVNTFSDVLKDEQARANGYVVDREHPRLGQVTMPGYPAVFAQHDVGPAGPAPTLGQHTDDVLSALGYPAATLERLRADGVIA